jgi:hypothetical protein
MESMQPKARSAASTRMNEPISVTAELRQALEDAGRHLQAGRGDHPGPRHARVMNMPGTT